MKRLRNIHPGEVLLEEFLKPMDISQNAIARAIGVPPRRINEIVLGKRGITADTAIRLAKHFGTSEQFWMGLQADYDLEEARKGMRRPSAGRLRQARIERRLQELRSVQGYWRRKARDKGILTERDLER
jgi:addiction module HigA family antidote